MGMNQSKVEMNCHAMKRFLYRQGFELTIIKVINGL